MEDEENPPVVLSNDLYLKYLIIMAQKAEF